MYDSFGFRNRPVRCDRPNACRAHRNERKEVVLCALVLVAGCSQTPPKTVWVDLDQALVELAPLTSKLDSAPAPSPEKSVMTLSGIDPRTITNRVQVEPEATIGTIRAEQEKARKNLEIRLKAMYAREAIRLERELRQTSAAEISQLDLGILSEVSEAVQQLGRERSFPLSRLAFVAGFPDKNPQSIIRKVDKNWIEEKQTADAIRYREELAQADKRFAEKLSAIQGRLSASKKQKLDTVARQIALFREELEKRASREAQSEVQNTLDELGIQLATSEPWNLEKVGSQRQEVSFGASRPGSEVPLTSVSRGASVASDLRLFLKVHRYVLGVKGRSQDATKEFLEWQKEMRRGR